MDAKGKSLGAAKNCRNVAGSRTEKYVEGKPGYEDCLAATDAGHGRGVGRTGGKAFLKGIDYMNAVWFKITENIETL